MEGSTSPVVDDMSVFLLGGRVSSAAPAIPQAADAERLGFRRVWLCERYDLKEAGVVLSAAAATTSRLEVGSAPVTISARPPKVTAALGATMQSLFPGRFTLGVGRGPSAAYAAGYGFAGVGYQALIDYCDIIRRLWRGESVTYDGPVGSYSNLRLDDVPDGPPPGIMFAHFCGPKASRIGANPVFDAVMPAPLMTPEAVYNSVTWTRQECERIGRDPASVRVVAAVATAPEMDEFEAASLITARLVMTFQMPDTYKLYPANNGWDIKIVEAVRNHPMFRNMQANTSDQAFNSAAKRAELLEVAKLIPDSYVREVAAFGSLSDCVKKLQQYKDAGVDEIACYTSTAAQNGNLLAAWQDHQLSLSAAEAL